MFHRVLNTSLYSLSTHNIWPVFPFYTPWKHQKTKVYLVFLGFLLFSGGYEMRILARDGLKSRENENMKYLV